MEKVAKRKATWGIMYTDDLRLCPFDLYDHSNDEEASRQQS